MINTLKRLLLFIIAVPGFVLLTLYVPHLDYIWVTITLTLVGLKSGIEMRKILNRFSAALPAWTIVFPLLAPGLSWCTRRGWISMEFNLLLLTLALIWPLVRMAFIPKEEVSASINRMGYGLLMVLYPGFFLWWIDAIPGVTHGASALLVFILGTFLNDSVAWLVGNIFGKHRNLTAISPNKSLEGFIAGILTSLAVIVGLDRIYPHMLNIDLWLLVILGIAVGIAAILGDLTESAIKRAADVKDSGKLMLGRGGMLDSIDSLLFTAPLIYLIFTLGN